MAGIYSTTEIATELSKIDKFIEYQNLGVCGVLHANSRSTGRVLCLVSVQAAYRRIMAKLPSPLCNTNYLDRFRIRKSDIYYTSKGNRSKIVDAWITSR